MVIFEENIFYILFYYYFSSTAQVVYVAGGCGTVGSAVVKELLSLGAIVWVSSRNQSRLDELNDSIPLNWRSNLRLHQASVSNENECLELKNAIFKKDSKINHVVASLGSWWNKGCLSEQSVDEFEKVFVENTKIHFLVYKTFAKCLNDQPNSTYTFISGALGEGCETMPETSLLSVSAAALFGLYLAAYSEYLHSPNLNVNEVRYATMIRDKLDKMIDQTENDYEVGKDWAAKFVTKVILEHKTGSHRIYGRKQGDQFFKTF